ncbi:hypothetical protein HK096_007293 [Nowakowskiella sp. JEL0078]|nr:hypothetical protein HK096_007293 [Nowakowskiella sp. JEL0078]
MYRQNSTSSIIQGESDRKSVEIYGGDKGTVRRFLTSASGTLKSNLTNLGPRTRRSFEDLTSRLSSFDIIASESRGPRANETGFISVNQERPVNPAVSTNQDESDRSSVNLADEGWSSLLRPRKSGLIPSIVNNAKKKRSRSSARSVTGSIGDLGQAKWVPNFIKKKISSDDFATEIFVGDENSGDVEPLQNKESLSAELVSSLVESTDTKKIDLAQNQVVSHDFQVKSDGNGNEESIVRNKLNFPAPDVVKIPISNIITSEHDGIKGPPVPPKSNKIPTSNVIASEHDIVVNKVDQQPNPSFKNDVLKGLKSFSEPDEIENLDTEENIYQDENLPLLVNLQNTRSLEYPTESRRTQIHRYKHQDNPHGATISQATLNSINVLMGVAILSLPFAFSLTGWVFGLGLLTMYCLVGNTTAKMIIRSIWLATRLGEIENYISNPQTTEDTPLLNAEAPEIEIIVDDETDTHPPPRKNIFISSYADIGGAAFGRAGRTFIGLLFTFELFAAATATVILLADSLCALFVTQSPPPTFFGLSLSTVFKIGATALLVPTTFPRSSRFLSYFSLLGIMTIMFVISILFGNGLSTPEAPGSLLDPAETSLLPPKFATLPLAVGLLIVGVDAHAIFPSLYNDMKDKRQFKKVLDYTYIVLFLVYASVASAGYLMFGGSTMPEITQNLASIEKYNQFWTKLTLWLVAVNPATKYALILNPVNHNLESILHYYFPKVVSNPHAPTASSIANIAIRTMSGVLVLWISVAFPGFHRIVALIGAACSSIIAVMFPVACYVALEGNYTNQVKFYSIDDSENKEKRISVWVCVSIFIIGAITAVVGTFGVFVPLEGHTL